MQGHFDQMKNTGKNIIAVIFDFDDTLAPDSTTGYLSAMGVDVASFWETVQGDIEDGWDPVPAYLYRMIRLTEDMKIKVSRESLIDWGKRCPLKKGVTTIFSRLIRQAARISPDIKLEFYVISSGIGDIVRNTKIAQKFTGIWCSEFNFTRTGAADFPKRVISFTDKTRYIFQISKGFIDEKYMGRPFEVNKKVNPGEYRIPMDQLIFVGDGFTDVPCFSLVKKNGGVAIAVYDRDEKNKWGRAWSFIEDGRVSNLVSADYSSKSDLSNSLTMAVESIASKMVLRAGGYHL